MTTQQQPQPAAAPVAKRALQVSKTFPFPVTQVENRAAVAKLDKLSDGLRYAYVGFKIPSDLGKTPDKVFPANFCAAVPRFNSDADWNTPDFRDMLQGLFDAYYDGIVRDVALGNSTVNLSNLPDIIADFFDTSREREGPTVKDCVAWAEEKLAPAMIARMIECNDAPNVKQRTDKEIANMAERYVVYIREALKRESTLATAYARSIKQQITLLIDLGKLSSCDEAERIIGACDAIMERGDDIV